MGRRGQTSKVKAIPRKLVTSCLDRESSSSPDRYKFQSSLATIDTPVVAPGSNTHCSQSLGSVGVGLSWLSVLKGAKQSGSLPVNAPPVVSKSQSTVTLPAATASTNLKVASGNPLASMSVDAAPVPTVLKSQYHNVSVTMSPNCHHQGGTKGKDTSTTTVVLPNVPIEGETGVGMTGALTDVDASNLVSTSLVRQSSFPLRNGFNVLNMEHALNETVDP
ncbi:unnamed protein product [Amaranthus hypochondriacus]